MLESKDCLTLSVPPDNESNIPIEFENPKIGVYWRLSF